MPWYKFSGEKISTNISSTEEELSVSGDATFKKYVPQQFNLDLTQINQTYLNKKGSGSGFVMNDAVKKISGIDDIEKKAEKEVIEKKVSSYIEEIKQQAYDAAYAQGLENGFKSATEERHKEINQAIDDFKNLINSISSLKTELINQNEAHLVTMVFKIAEKIACDHLNENTEPVVSIMKKAIEESQIEENITVHVSDKQVDYIENLKKITGREFDFLKTVKLEPSSEISVGGCVIETNYGSIDAQVESRIENLWSELKKSLPKIKKIAV